MKEITILGAGIAGLELARNLRAKDPSFKIALIDKNPYFFDKKEFILKLAAKKIVEAKSWAQNQNIEFIQGTIERVSINRKKIYFKEGNTLEFKTLVVATGLISKKVSLKGEHREGFFYLSNINPLVLKDLLKISSEATVYVSGILGLKLAIALKALGKEVRVLVSSFDFLLQNAQDLIDFLNEKGVPFHINVSIEEAIGEGAVKAVKISPLKVFSSQLVFVDSGFLPNYSFFEEELLLRDNFFSNFEEIYFLGDINSQNIESERFYLFNQEEAKRQAEIFSDYILEGKNPIFEKKVVALEDRQRVIKDLIKPSDCIGVG